MRRPDRSRARALALLVAGGVAIAGVGLARSAIPGGNGVIQGCYDNTNGALRVIDAEAGAQCQPPRETAISWSQVGPAGPQGVPGPAGPQGPAGPAGGDAQPSDSPAPPAARKPVRALSRKLVAALAAAPPNGIRSVYNDKGGRLPPDEGANLTVLALPLPAGRWAVTAKANSYARPDVDITVLFIGPPRCRLSLGPEFDNASIARGGGQVVATVVGRLKKPGAAELRCWSYANGPDSGVERISVVKITGVPGTSLVNTPAKFGVGAGP